MAAGSLVHPVDPSKRVTALDVARYVGTSRPTVSSILFGGRSNTRVSEALRQRVLAAAEELGYRPNTAARAIRRGSSKAIGILQSENSGKGCVRWPTLYAIQQQAANRDMHLSMGLVPDTNLSDPAGLPKILREWSVDGLLIAYTAEIPPLMFEHIKKYHIPAVWMNVKLDHDCVHLDDFGGARGATQALLERGHRRVAFVGEGSTGTLSEAWGGVKALPGLFGGDTHEGLVTQLSDSLLQEHLQRAPYASAGQTFAQSRDESISVTNTLTHMVGMRDMDAAYYGYDLNGTVNNRLERGLRGGGTFMLTVAGGAQILTPKAPPGSLYSYSRQSSFTGNIFQVGHAGRAWATVHKPGPWAFNPGFGNSIMRMYRTGSVKPFKSFVEIQGPALTQFRPVTAFGPVRGWKQFGGQWFTRRPGNLNLLTGEIASPTFKQSARFYSDAFISHGVDASVWGVTVFKATEGISNE